MKAFLIPLFAASLAVATPAFADADHHPGKGGQPMQADPSAMIERMQDNARKMQAQVAAIANAKSDDERRAAMSEHMRTMQENMQLTRAMQGGIMDCPMHPGGMSMMGDAGGADTHSRMHQMEQRMDMMQMMMQRMMGSGTGPAMPMK